MRPVTKDDIYLFNGNYLDFNTPDVELLDIKSIAAGLATQSRFKGQAKNPVTNRPHFYAVAQHSVIVSIIVELSNPELGVAALLHDAPEFILGDMAGPWKKNFPDYIEHEARFSRLIEKRFEIPEYSLNDPLIKEVDMRMLHTERMQLNMEDGNKWPYEDKYPPYENTAIRPYSSDVAYDLFLERAATLGIK